MTEQILSVSGVDFAYSKTAPALKGVDLEVRPGQIVGLVGPNGSGKSTLIKLVFDLLQLQTGRIQVLGSEAGSSAARLSSIYLPSDDQMPEFLTGLEYVRTVAELYNRLVDIDAEAIAGMFDRFGMADRQKHLIEDYSHGMRKKTQLLTAFLLQLPLTVVDETLNGIDLDAIRQCHRAFIDLRAAQKSVLLCTHDFSLLEEVADRVVVMSKGQVIEQIELTAGRERVSNERLSNERLSDTIGRVLYDE